MFVLCARGRSVDDEEKEKEEEEEDAVSARASQVETGARCVR